MTSKNNISRRKFLKIFGGGSVAAAAVMAGCTPEKNKATTASALGEVPTDSMTYRTNPKTGEKVSLLGYGCMRLPTKMGVSGREDKDNDIDQEEVNRLLAECRAQLIELSVPISKSICPEVQMSQARHGFGWCRDNTTLDQYKYEYSLVLSRNVLSRPAPEIRRIICRELQKTGVDL